MYDMQTQMTLRLSEEFLAVALGDRPFERMHDLIGSIASGLPDLAERHRDYLVQRLRNGQP